MTTSTHESHQCGDCGKIVKKGAKLPGGAWICRKCSKARRKAKKEGKR